MKKHLKEILKTHRELVKTDQNSGDWLKKYEQLRIELRSLINRVDLSVLSKLEIIQLTALVSRYRPVEPFRYLMIFAKYFGE